MSLVEDIQKVEVVVEVVVEEEEEEEEEGEENDLKWEEKPLIMRGCQSYGC